MLGCDAGKAIASFARAIAIRTERMLGGDGRVCEKWLALVVDEN